MNLERYKELVEMLPETIYEMDLTGNLTFVNQKSYERFGYTQEDFERGLNAFSMIIPEERNKARANMAKIINGERGFNEYTALRKDGTTFPTKFYSSVIYDAGNPVGLRGFIVDITDLKKVEESLCEERDALQKALSELKVLRGLLPICGVCKKIRDDKGYWNKIESYISEHSEAEFSHSICPECSRRLYPASSEKEISERQDSEESILKGSETLLLVDDEAIIIEVGMELLDRLGYKVMVARSGNKAIETYEENQAHIDLVILDINMPDMSGGETYDCLKKINPHVKVLLSSGYNINGEAQEIIKRGCNGFIQKPFNLNELSQKLREILYG